MSPQVYLVLIPLAVIAFVIVATVIREWCLDVGPLADEDWCILRALVQGARVALPSLAVADFVAAQGYGMSTGEFFCRADRLVRRGLIFFFDADRGTDPARRGRARRYFGLTDSGRALLALKEPLG